MAICTYPTPTESKSRQGKFSIRKVDSGPAWCQPNRPGPAHKTNHLHLLPPLPLPPGSHALTHQQQHGSTSSRDRRVTFPFLLEPSLPPSLQNLLPLQRSPTASSTGGRPSDEAPAAAAAPLRRRGGGRRARPPRLPTDPVPSPQGHPFSSIHLRPAGPSYFPFLALPPFLFLPPPRPAACLPACLSVCGHCLL